MSESNEQEILDRKKAALAEALQRRFHPELLTAIISDEGATEIADAINDLIEHHCLKVRMALT